MIYTVSENVQITLDGQKYLLETGDKIVLESFLDSASDDLDAEIDIKDFLNVFYTENPSAKELNPNDVSSLFIRWMNRNKPNYMSNLSTRLDQDRALWGFKKIATKLIRQTK